MGSFHSIRLTPSPSLVLNSAVSSRLPSWTLAANPTIFRFLTSLYFFTSFHLRRFFSCLASPSSPSHRVRSKPCLLYRILQSSDRAIHSHVLSFRLS
ncbi:hypothetical protein VTK73DRAFT_2786 [Phialemonium thermophilum]|uniref:Uncharacterized protein n=1 Tax=Phialemonium thermophilum TaxID=223376 RepID=A0ABR3VQ76_9PEZI